MRHLSVVSAPLTREDFPVEVSDVVWHRNGSSGESFHVVTFTFEGEPLTAVCFFTQDDDGRYGNYDEPRVAVLSLSDTSLGYRGDYFADELLGAVQGWYDAKYGLAR